MTKILNGRELASFIKERQFGQVAAMQQKPHLLILRDSENPVIKKYVNLKKQYGQDIGVAVTDHLAETASLDREILRANNDPSINGIIIQLPLKDKSKTDELCNLISPDKDVDGLGVNAKYDSATATAILWLLAGYDIPLKNQKIALVGRGKLVGAPLFRILQSSGHQVELFHRGSDLTKLKQYDIIITATGQPGLITSSMLKPGASIIDAGTASENGVLKGDLEDEARSRQDLSAITPKSGGVGPLTISCLFDHVITSASR